MDRHPAVVRINNGDADDTLAAQRVPAQVEVDRVATKDALLAKMGKAGVTDRTGTMTVVHGMTAHPIRIGTLDDDVAREIGHLAAVLLASPGVKIFQCSIEGNLRPLNLLDTTLLSGELLVRDAIASITRDDDLVTNAPPADIPGKGERGVSGSGIGTEIQPRPAHRSTVKIHAPARPTGE